MKGGKPGLAIVLGSKAPESSPDVSSDLDAVIEEICEAVESKDSDALREALHSFAVCCKSEEE